MHSNRFKKIYRAAFKNFKKELLIENNQKVKPWLSYLTLGYFYHGCNAQILGFLIMVIMTKYEYLNHGYFNHNGYCT